MSRDKELDEVLAGIRQKRDGDIATLQSECERLIQIAEQRITEAIRFHGKNPCPECDSTGAIAKWNSDIWRKFGLSTWTGCKNCGGCGDEKGCGYVDA